MPLGEPENVTEYFIRHGCDRKTSTFVRPTVVDLVSPLLAEVNRLQAIITEADNHPLALAEGGTNGVDRCHRALNKLSTADWYWDDNDLETAHEKLDDAVDYYDNREIIPLRPLHELPMVYVLVDTAEDGGSNNKVFASPEAAEKAKEATP